jgi:hypothetical protein
MQSVTSKDRWIDDAPSLSTTQQYLTQQHQPDEPRGCSSLVAMGSAANIFCLGDGRCEANQPD